LPTGVVLPSINNTDMLPTRLYNKLPLYTTNGISDFIPPTNGMTRAKITIFSGLPVYEKFPNFCCDLGTKIEDY
jgi:hypothetical protein